MKQSTIEALQRLSMTPDPNEARAVQSELVEALGDAAPEYTELLAALVARVEEVTELQRLAGTDPLTHAVNRRGFLEALERELARSERSGTEVAVLLIDLDGFKKLNDELGHLEGDRALVQVSRALEEAVRGADLVARLGGDEFAVLLPLDKVDVAFAVAGRLRRAVLDVHIVDRNLSTSIGIATTATAPRTPTGLLQAADQNLYADKRRRRARRGQQAA